MDDVDRAREVVATKRKRTAFTEVQKQNLEAAFEDGLNSAAADKAEAIEELARSLDLEVRVVKNFIGNKRKTLHQRDEKENADHQPRKLRKLSAYNVFAAEYLRSEEAKDVERLAEKNRRIGRRWRDLDDEAKSKYYTAAKEESTCDASSKGSWQTISKVLGNMNANCKWVSNCGAEMFYVLCHGANHYAGGTGGGIQYLQEHPNIPMDFLYFRGSQSDQAQTCSGRVEWKRARKAVQELLNLKYALVCGNPKAKVPYQTILPGQVKNFPVDLKFGPPSSFGLKGLQKILDSSDKIYFDLSKGDCMHKEHSYAKPPAMSGKSNPSASSKRKGGTKLLPCTGTLEDVMGTLVTAATKSTAVKTVAKKTITTHIPPNASVSLLENDRVVAKALTLAGDVLHGHPIPGGYIKVIVEQVFDPSARLQVEDRLDDGDGCLAPNIITAWRNECLRRFTST